MFYLMLVCFQQSKQKIPTFTATYNMAFFAHLQVYAEQYHLLSQSLYVAIYALPYLSQFRYPVPGRSAAIRLIFADWHIKFRWRIISFARILFIKPGRQWPYWKKDVDDKRTP